MTATFENIVQHLFHQPSLQSVSVEELKRMVDQHPSFAAGQYLLLKKMQDIADPDFNTQLRKTSIYFHNPLWLQFLLQPVKEPAARSVSQPEANIYTTVTSVNTDGIMVETPVVDQTELAVHPEDETPFELAKTAITTAAAAAEASTIQEEAVPAATPEAGNASFNEMAAIHPDPADDNRSALHNLAATTDLQHQEHVNAISLAEAYQYQAEPASVQVPEHTAEISTEVPLLETTLPEAQETKLTEQAGNLSSAPMQDLPDITPPSEPVIQEEHHEPATELESRPVEAFSEPITASPIEHIAPENLAANAEPDNIEIPGDEPTATTRVIADSEAKESAAVPQMQEPEQPIAENWNAGTKLVYKPYEPVISKEKEEIAFEPYHTIDYFASQGINLNKVEPEPTDRLGKQLRSFTEWLKSMKKLPQATVDKLMEENEESQVVAAAIHSVETKEVITEAMAEVYEKQGLREKAVDVYRKLSLQNPSKSAYFASRIEDLKSSI